MEHHLAILLGDNISFHICKVVAKAMRKTAIWKVCSFVPLLFQLRANLSPMNTIGYL